VETNSLGRADVVLDALPVAAWPDQREEHSPSRLVVPWPLGSGTAQTTVEITLAPVSGGTRVDVRHEGWESGPSAQDALAGHFAGWLQALAALGLIVESGKDPRASSASLAGRRQVLRLGGNPAGVDAVFRALFGPGGTLRWSEGALEGAELGRFRRGPLRPMDARRAGGRRAREVVMILRLTAQGNPLRRGGVRGVGRSSSARWPGCWNAWRGFSTNRTLLMPDLRRMFDYDRWANREALASLSASPSQARGLKLNGAHRRRRALWHARLTGQNPELPVWPDLSPAQCEIWLSDLERLWDKYLERAVRPGWGSAWHTPTPRASPLPARWRTF